MNSPDLPKQEGTNALEGSMFLKLSSPKLPIQKPTPNYLEHSLFSVMSADELLRNPRWQVVLNEIKQIITLPEEHYQSIYDALIANFAAFVQVIPTTPGGFLGTILDEALHRALIAVQLYLDAAEADVDPLYTFAIFSAALMIDVRKVLANKKIMISDEEGAFIAEWQPFAGAMAPDSHYKIRNYSQPMSRLSPYLTVVLALKIMPEKAYLWLCEDYNLLNMWLSALNGDIENAGGIGHFLDMAKIRLRQLREKNVRPIVVHTKEPTNPDITLAEEFFAWLKKHANADNVVVTKDGILLEAKVFEEFAATIKKAVNWIKLQEAFNYLGFTQLSGADVRHKHAFSDAPDTKNTKAISADKKSLGGFFNQLASQVATAAKQSVIKTGSLISSNWLPIARKLKQSDFTQINKASKAEERITVLNKTVLPTLAKELPRTNTLKSQRRS